MLRVGLTGGIGSGKTTVAAMLRELGCAVIEADPLAHEMIEPGRPAYDDVVRGFGSAILGPDRRIDRNKLAEIVFADPARLGRLNQIVHPRVTGEIQRRLAGFEKQGQPVAIVEAALLIETGYDQQGDRLVVVWCKPQQQRERLRARGMSDEQIERRMAAQMPLEEKRRLADDLIDNSGTLDETERQVERLARRLERLAAERPVSGRKKP